MKQTETLIVGASVAGLACAACLQRKGIEYRILEKHAQVGWPWRNHYDRLHLHTSKRMSNLPFLKFDSKVQRYPSRLQVVDYLERYQKEFNINPVFNTEVRSIRREGVYWITETGSEWFQSKYIIMATGAFGNPNRVNFQGMESFPGRIMHSSTYKTGKDFQAQRVLVVGFGNSACEIALDLYEQKAFPSMSVRSAVNIVPRDVAGISIVELSLIMSRLPPHVADAINAPLMRLMVGDITKLGLKKMPYGPFQEIKKDRNIPVLDIGTVQQIRRGNIRVYRGIDHIEGSVVHFSDGKKDAFDAIVACIGFSSKTDIVTLDQDRLEDLKAPVYKQKYFGKDGLYFCGFWVGATGHIREIASDARRIAKDISLHER